MAIGSKILVVDDDDSFRLSVANFLEGKGYVVTQAENGDLGKFMTLLSKYDLIISDIHMPEIDGLSFAQYLRSKFSIPLILMSGNPPENTDAVAAELGVYSVLRKPIQPDTLFEVVGGALNSLNDPA